MKRLVVLFMALIMVFTFVSCEDKTPVEYTVSYEGIERVDEKVLEGSKYVVPDDIPARPGFITVIKSGDKTVDPGDVIEVTGDIKLVVAYVPGDYKVTFEGIERAAEDVQGGSDYTVPSDIPARPGFITVIKSGDKTLNPGDVIEVTGDIKLVVAYVPEDFKVTFEGIERAAEDVKGGADYTVPSDIPAKPGYVTVIKLGEEVRNPGDKITVTEDIKLTVSYVAGDFKVTFEGIERASEDVQGGSDYTVPSDIPAKPGFITVIKSGDKTVDPGDVIEVTGDIKLVVAYVPGDYKVTFKGVVKDPVEVEGGTDYTIPKDLVKEGHKLTSIMYGTEDVFSKDTITVVGNIELEYVFTEVYTVTFSENTGLEARTLLAGDELVLPYVEGHNTRSIKCGDVAYKPGSTITVNGDMTLVYEMLAGTANLDIQNGVVKGHQQTKENQIVIPDVFDGAEVYRLDSSCFKDQEMSSIVLPDTLSAIYSSAFWNCRNLKSIYIPSKVDYIQNGVFEGCTGLEKIEVDPDNKDFHVKGNCLVEKEGARVIAGCKNSTIAEGIRILGHVSFSGIGLTEVVLPESLEEIHDYALSGCSTENFRLPKNVREIRDAGLSGFTYKTLEVDPENQYFSSSSNCLVNKTDKSLIKVPTGQDKYEFTDINSIVSDAFRNNKAVIEVSLPDTVTNIGSHAFDGCHNLKTMNIPSALQSIGSYAFSGCMAWTMPDVIPDTVEYIGDYAFQNVTLPETMTIGAKTIGYNAFKGCGGMKKLILTSNVNTLDYYAFMQCYKLEEVTLPEGLETIRSNAFASTMIKTIRIPSTVTRMGDNVFSGCSQLATVYVAKGALDQPDWSANWLGTAAGKVQVVEYEVGK